VSADGRAPRLARLLLRLRPLGDRHHEIAADLHELFVKRASMLGPREARRRYRRDVLSVLLRRTPGRRPPAAPPEPGGRAGWLAGVVDDLRYGTRVFRRQPTLVALALAGLAVALGVATAAFTFAHAAFLRPIAVAEPDSVVSITRVTGRMRIELGGMTLGDFETIRRAATTVRPEAAFRTSALVSDAIAGLAEQPLRTTFVSDTFFDTFGARPAAGRLLARSDDVAGAPPVAVLMHARWRTTFRGDPHAIGRTLYVNGVPVTIVGALEDGFGGPFKTADLPDMYLPASAVSQIEDASRLERYRGVATLAYEVSGRLVGGATVEQADAEVQAIGASIGLRLDDPQRPNGIVARPAGQALDGDVIGLLAVVVVVVGLVVLLAAANVANLLLAGTTTRGQEIAARLALGASPRRILRQLVTESVLLAVVAGGAGVLAAAWFTAVAARMLDASPSLDLSPSPAVMAIIGAISLAVGLVAGLGPARHAIRADVSAVLKGTSTAVAAGSMGRLRSSFIALQAAASILLLVSTALFARALVEASSLRLPFDPDRLVEVEATSYGGAATVPPDEFWPLALDRALALPGVEAASLVERGPFGAVHQNPTSLPGLENYPVLVPRVDHGFFDVTQVRVLSGRTFSADEVARNAPVVVVSEKLARDFWPGRNPIGQNPSHVADDQPDAEVIGVVEDVPWSINPPRYFGAATMFRPLGGRGQARLLVRASDAAATMSVVRDAIGALDPGRRPRAVRVSDRLSGSLRLHAMFASIAGVLGMLALSLAFVGLFGVTAFVVGLRRREIGIRLAIGAGRRDVVGLVFRQGMRPVVVGLGVGLGLAVLGAQVFAGLLTGGVGPRDPIALASAVAALLVAGAIGVLVPARRVLAIEPTEVLREQ
jgi:predicted permease